MASGVRDSSKNSRGLFLQMHNVSSADLLWDKKKCRKRKANVSSDYFAVERLISRRTYIKSLEHRRIEQALILVYESIHNQTPNYIQEMFSLRSNGYSLRGHLKVVLPRPTSSYMQHSFTYQASKQWNNLTDKIRMSESLSIFRKNLQDIQLSSSYDCSCLFCKQIV